ncbi:MAG: hypothetical protein IPH69_02185 [Bacteroidales bacterium]|nr:hypothetical protein [Bacteroidales bacterium]
MRIIKFTFLFLIIISGCTYQNKSNEMKKETEISQVRVVTNLIQVLFQLCIKSDLHELLLWEETMLKYRDSHLWLYKQLSMPLKKQVMVVQ